MKKLLEINDNLPIGVDIIRMITGAIIISFGIELFNAEQMAGYEEWLTDVGVPASSVMSRIGKLAELMCGIGLTLGLYTRLSSIPLIITMVVVNFIMLDGNPISQPFYLMLLFAVFLFLGSGKLSIDFLLQSRSTNNKT